MVHASIAWGACLGAGILTGGAGCAPAYASVVGAGVPFQTVEAGFGILSAAATAGADLLSGNSGIDVSTQELVVGGDSLVAVAAQSIGLIYEPSVDFAVNLANMAYLVTREGQQYPAWEYRYDLSFTDGRYLGYIRRKYD